MPDHQPIRTLNFVSPRAPRRALQFATAAVCGLCAVILWTLILGSPIGGAGTAAITDHIGTSPTPSMSPSVTAVPKALSTAVANSIALGLDQDTVRYYEPTTGRAFVVDLRKGQLQSISDRKLPGFIRSWWLPGTTKVISAFDERGTVEHRSYDYATGTATVIGTAIVELGVAPDGRHIVYADTKDDTLSVFTAENDGAAARHILATRALDLQLEWPSPDFLSLSSRRPDRTGRDLALARMDGTLVVTISNRENLEYTWSRDGRKLLFSYFLPGEGISLWYRDLAQGRDIRVALATSARKCAWHSDGQTITCGVPSNDNLSPDIPADRVATTDNIITLDIRSGQQTEHFTAKPGSLVGIVDPLLSSSGRYVVFLNVFDQRLYSFEL